MNDNTKGEHEMTTATAFAGEILDLDQLCAYTGLKKSNVYYKTSRGKIPYLKAGGLLRFRRSEIDRWLREGARRR